MAGFKTHVSGGAVIGIVAAVGYSVNVAGSTFLQTGAILFLGVLGSLLPDLDSDSGRPIKLLFSMVSSLLVLSVVSIWLSGGNNFSSIVVAAICTYASCYIFFVLCKKMTVHRGIMHSIPFAILSGFAAAILVSNNGTHASSWAGGTLFAGVMSHLLLDEINSIGFRMKLVPYVKRSFGTALKFRGGSLLTTISIYCLIGALAFGYLLML